MIALGKYIESMAEWRAMRREDLDLPQYSLGEEIVNAITHGVGTGLAIAGLVVLLVMGRPDPLTRVSASIFGSGMILFYLVSTLYHALAVNQGKKVFHILDHCTVFLLIAATYTPITLLSFRGVIGWTLFGVAWGVAALGIVLTAVNLRRFRVFTIVCYLALGWVVIFFFKLLLDNLDFTSVVLLLSGGAVYTLGAIVYWLGQKHKYLHSLWHLFVLAGTILHYFVIYRIVIA